MREFSVVPFDCSLVGWLIDEPGIGCTCPTIFTINYCVSLNDNYHNNY